MSRRRSPSPLKNFPPVLYRLVRAAEFECLPEHSEALTAFIGLALRRVPVSVTLDPGSRSDAELDDAIHSIAKAHVELDQALAAWRSALKAAQLALKPQDEVAAAVVEIHCESDVAYFYAGLAFGLVFSGASAVVE